jgi:hypothetical protein
MVTRLAADVCHSVSILKNQNSIPIKTTDQDAPARTKSTDIHTNLFFNVSPRNR